MDRIHYYKGLPQNWHTSCGLHLSEVEMWTTKPQDVTCKNCTRAMLRQVAKGIIQKMDEELDMTHNSANGTSGKHPPQ